MRKVITVISLLTIVISVAVVSYFFIKQKNFADNMLTLEEKITTPVQKDDAEKTLNFSELTAINPDIVAWVKIEGTSISYPIMQNSDNEEYYIDHNFEKEKDPNGLPFLDARNSPLLQDDNVIVYGHNMKTGRMFHALEDYESQDFLETHDIILLDTPDGRRIYRVFAVFKEKITTENSFNYNFFTNFKDSEEKEQLIQDALESSLHGANIEVDTNASMLTLSTCDNITFDGRIAVIAFEITE